MSHYNRIRYLAELNKNISVKTNDEHNMLIDAIRNKDKRMYLRVIKAHISRIFNELDKLKGIYPEYFEKNWCVWKKFPLYLHIFVSLYKNDWRNIQSLRQPFLIYSLFVLYHLAVLRRSHIFKLFKKLGKVVHIVDATLCGNILNSWLCCVEQIYCMLDSFIVDEVRQSYSGFFFKERW